MKLWYDPLEVLRVELVKLLESLKTLLCETFEPCKGTLITFFKTDILMPPDWYYYENRSAEILEWHPSLFCRVKQFFVPRESYITYWHASLWPAAAKRCGCHSCPFSRGVAHVTCPKKARVEFCCWKQGKKLEAQRLSISLLNVIWGLCQRASFWMQQSPNNCFLVLFFVKFKMTVLKRRQTTVSFFLLGSWFCQGASH